MYLTVAKLTMVTYGRARNQLTRVCLISMILCGEAIGPWVNGQGSAGGSSNGYEEDGFLVSDHDPVEYEIDNDDEDKDVNNEFKSNEGSDYESATDFIRDGDEDKAESNVDSQELVLDIEDDMPLDELQRSPKSDKNKYEQEADSDGWGSPSPSPRKLTRLKKKLSQGMMEMKSRLSLDK